MARTRFAVGVTALVAGIVVALVPGFSVWRAGGEMLNELPSMHGVETIDQRVGWTAFFDDDFVLARRTYLDSDKRSVADALQGDGFAGVGRLSKDCCGGFDAAWADIQENNDGSTVVALTGADDDWQASWPAWLFVGIVTSAAGLLLLLRARPVEAPAMMDHLLADEPVPLP